MGRTISTGVGVRAVSGEKTGFAYADQISKLALEQSARAARTIVRDTGNGKVQTLGAVEHRALYTSIDPLQSMTREEAGYSAPGRQSRPGGGPAGAGGFSQPERGV